MNTPWAALEKEAAKRLRVPLKNYASVLSRAMSSAEALLRLPRARGLAEVSEVRAALLSQTIVACRTVLLVTRAGYPLQGMAMLANVYELATALAFAGHDPNRARQWMEHELDHESFPSTRQRKLAMRELLLAGGFTEPNVASAVNEWEERYRAFCMAKHGNPKVLRHYGVRRSSASFAIAVSPLSGGPYTRLAQLVMLRAAQLLMMAQTVYGSRETQEEGAALSTRVGKRVYLVARALAELQSSTSNETPD